ncbi:hypothetical protein FPSM_00808 [Flavobacterium psychrophilum]|nr:hypothetical protein FPSM_00808 [Flavobacterium psychrophilum]
MQKVLDNVPNQTAVIFLFFLLINDKGYCLLINQYLF